MDRFQFFRDGMIRLPPGFRFQPTDEELVFQYLRCKIFSFPLPAPIIPEINICKYDPWDLPGNLEHERYFFSNKEAKYRNGNRINRATASGYWKATGLDKQILSSSMGNQMVGMKKTLVFYRGKPSHESRTDWVMHEYRLVNVVTTASSYPEPENSSQNYMKEMENWVICRVFLKKRNVNDENIVQTSKDTKRKNNSVAAAQPHFFDFMMRDEMGLGSANSSSSSTSSFNGMSEVSSNESGYDDEESSSSHIF
ncbi:NAC domain containing protein [Melia azedarach]|uniref:NAC domain containing protein n=1 Tax=Melia azedarach TaxID=155640 RepID=A0ACC1YZB0_MELAZ|nr:NAC domain containing protein [Melia azedarach]